MKKSGLIIGLVALVLLGAGIVWLIINKTASPANTTQHTASSSNSPDSSPADTSVTPQAQSGTVDVAMQNTSFIPQHIIIKKGTKVTWTNKDVVKHNVVADNAGNAAGLPTTNELLSQNSTYSFTFTTTGTFTYHCTPHPFMKGTVEVVE